MCEQDCTDDLSIVLSVSKSANLLASAQERHERNKPTEWAEDMQPCEGPLHSTCKTHDRRFSARTQWNSPEEVELLSNHSEACVLGEVQRVVADQVASVEQVLNLHMAVRLIRLISVMSVVNRSHSKNVLPSAVACCEEAGE